ncbi:DUF6924 domain-containing protein [Kitasatospora sp. NPDC092286]|uniref:DUF6924 domain-containing protein n=1 Tax=Kitasatospora sp. NPDC092286 TaxID=3364087 RepID=UPI00380A8D84
MVRTDFSGSVSWECLRKVLATPNECGFLPGVELLDDPRFAGATCAGARNLLPGDYRHRLLVLADTVALGSAELPVVVVDLWGGPGRFIRVVAAELWGIENNPSIANMDFDDFARAVDQDGAFKGFRAGSAGRPGPLVAADLLVRSRCLAVGE